MKHSIVCVIITGVHSDKDAPPQIPNITGVTPKWKEKPSLQETIISTAATAAAFVKAVNSGSVNDNSALVQSPTVQTIEVESPRARCGHTLTMSPIRMAGVWVKSFKQLSTLKDYSMTMCLPWMSLRTKGCYFVRLRE